MSVRYKPCDHIDYQSGRSAIRERDQWVDTADLTWVEDECRRCGRLWRTRALPFTESVPAKQAA